MKDVDEYKKLLWEAAETQKKCSWEDGYYRQQWVGVTVEVMALADQLLSLPSIQQCIREPLAVALPTSPLPAVAFINRLVRGVDDNTLTLEAAWLVVCRMLPEMQAKFVKGLVESGYLRRNPDAFDKTLSPWMRAFAEEWRGKKGE